MAEKPIRIQRKRTKGWKMPDNTVYVGRPTKWGNPWKITVHGRARALENFKHMMSGTLHQPWGGGGILNIKQELAGKNLACWCRLDQPCHADVLLEIANE